MNIPNVLSLLRLPLALAFLLTTDTTARVLIIAAAGASDFLDGWWARTRGPRTRTGALLDPLTDRSFVVAVLVAFLVEQTLSPAQLLILLARDIYVSLAFLLVMALRLPLTPRARFPGKLVTSLQILAVLVLTIDARAATPIVIAVAIAGAWAIVDYTVAGTRALRARRRAH